MSAISLLTIFAGCLSSIGFMIAIFIPPTDDPRINGIIIGIPCAIVAYLINKAHEDSHNADPFIQ